MVPYPNGKLERSAGWSRGQAVEERLIKLQAPVGGHVPEAADPVAVVKDFVIGENGRQQDGQRYCLCWTADDEPVPGEAAQIVITLGGPGLVGPQ